MAGGLHTAGSQSVVTFVQLSSAAATYFAWGLSLEPEHRSRLGLADGQPARLDKHRLVYTATSPAWRGRVGAVLPVAGHQVEGLLFTLEPERFAKVEAFEREQGGLRTTVSVITTGGPVSAQIFSPAPQRVGGPVDEAWIAALLRGLAQAKVSADYLQARTAEALILERVQAVTPAAPRAWNPTCP